MNKLTEPEEMPNYIHVELEGASATKGVKLGQQVAITILGTVKTITQREEPDGDTIAEICLEDYQSKIIPRNTSIFAELAEDD